MSESEPLQAIDEYIGICYGSVKADFCNDCAMPPDPAESNVEENNQLILEDCFQSKTKQKK